MLSKQEIPTQPRDLPAGPLYFVGIGGAGQSAIAFVLAQRGRVIRGADPGISDAIRARLESVGVTVWKTHHPEQVGDAAAVIATDAVNETNPEITEARRRGVPVFRRPEALGAILNSGRGIAVAGTHGKTTTTGMIASILLAAGLDPTILIGGDLPLIGGNARNGKDEIVLAEACEAYDGFLYLYPQVAVVLNIEADHLDYHGSEERMLESFQRFIGQVHPGGTLVACFNDKRVLEDILNEVPENVHRLTYSADPPSRDAMLNAMDVELQGPNPRFVIGDERGGGLEALGEVRLGVPGLHNVSNALAAAGVGLALGIPPERIIAGLEAFTGTGRRFEKLGEVKGVLLVDDYAHHPTELRATLGAARAAYPERRLIAVFQPHLYSRTRDFLEEFADSLTAADVVYLTDIYKAREEPIPGVSSEVLAEKVKARKAGLPVVYIPEKTDLPVRLLEECKPGDLLLTLGAGDIRQAGEGLLARLKGERE